LVSKLGPDAAFYVLEPDYGTRVQVLTEGYLHERPRCSVDPQHHGATLVSGPVNGVLTGKLVHDITWTNGFDLLLTDRARDALAKHNLTGYTLETVIVHYKSAIKPPPELWNVLVTGWAGMVSTESGISLKTHCVGCGRKTYTWPVKNGRLVEPSRWDGSDIFRVWPLPNHKFVSRKFADAIEEEGLTGVQIIRDQDFVTHGDSLSPGPLEASMSQELAERRSKSPGLV
jgi:hypothetical protein